MSYILIPQIVTDSTAMVWVGAVDVNVRSKTVTLEYNITSDTPDPTAARFVQLSQSEWRTWKTRHPLEKLDKDTPDIKVIHFQRVTIGVEKRLEKRTKYTLRLRVINNDPTEGADSIDARFEDYSKTIGADPATPVSGEDHLTKATVTTLPVSIPTQDEKPFTVMLGSCFYLPKDKDGHVGNTYLNMPDADQPDIKFLCGDQVYLDNPWKETTWNVALSVSPKENMRSFFFKKYLENWTQIKKVEVLENGVAKEKVVGGFNPLLRNGANYFCSDDHEYWNNAPNFGGAGAALTILRSQKRWWFREASELFRVFQSLAPWMTFMVDPVSFCIADTRINRTVHNIFTPDDDAQFMDGDDLKAIGSWIKNLEGPGVLVLGQVLLTDKANWRTTFKNLRDKGWFTRLKESFADYFDFSFPDFKKQFDELCGYIRESRHSIVLLTGDIHYGRLSVCKVRPDSDVEFIEIISSPMSVVEVDDKTPGYGTYETAVSVFGTDVISEPIGQSGEKPVPDNHFVTLEFTRLDESSSDVEMRVRSWPIVRSLITDPTVKVKPVEVKTIKLK